MSLIATPHTGVRHPLEVLHSCIVFVQLAEEHGQSPLGSHPAAMTRVANP